jgi:hypothetical protein
MLNPLDPILSNFQKMGLGREFCDSIYNTSLPHHDYLPTSIKLHRNKKTNQTQFCFIQYIEKNDETRIHLMFVSTSYHQRYHGRPEVNSWKTATTWANLPPLVVWSWALTRAMDAGRGDALLTWFALQVD